MDEIEKEKMLEPQEQQQPSITDDDNATEAKQVEEVQDILKGRNALLKRFRDANKDFTGDPSDDDLYDYAETAFGERDDYKGKFEGLNTANEELARVISQEPMVARFIGMIANGAHPMYAIGKCFGDIIDTLDEDSLEELQKGRKERTDRANQVRTNFQTYGETLKKYLADNKLSEEDGTRINDTILDIAEALVNGNIGVEIIDSVYKGLDYDNMREDEVNAAKLAGKNEAIDEIKEKRGGGNLLPPDVVSMKTNVPKGIFDASDNKPKSLSEMVRRQG